MSEFTGPSGSSRDLTNQEDFELLKKLRSLTDVIVTDSATARAEHYKASKWAPIEVWSESGNFQGVDNGITHKKIDNLEHSLARLEENFASILLETGPTLTTLIGQLGSVDQLKLTIVQAGNVLEARVAAKQALNRLSLNYLAESSAMGINGSYFFTFDR